MRFKKRKAALAELFIMRGPPANITSDNGSEFIVTVVQKWLAQIGVTTSHIVPGSTWEKGTVKASIGRFATNRSTVKSSIASPRRSY